MACEECGPAPLRAETARESPLHRSLNCCLAETAFRSCAPKLGRRRGTKSRGPIASSWWLSSCRTCAGDYARPSLPLRSSGGASSKVGERGSSVPFGKDEGGVLRADGGSPDGTWECRFLFDTAPRRPGPPASAHARMPLLKSTRQPAPSEADALRQSSARAHGTRASLSRDPHS